MISFLLNHLGDFSIDKQAGAFFELLISVPKIISTYSCFILVNVTEKDAGNYTCKANNTLGASNYTLAISVHGKFAIARYLNFLTSFYFVTMKTLPASHQHFSFNPVILFVVVLNIVQLCSQKNCFLKLCISGYSEGYQNKNHFQNKVFNCLRLLLWYFIL